MNDLLGVGVLQCPRDIEHDAECISDRKLAAALELLLGRHAIDVFEDQIRIRAVLIDA